MGSVLVTGATGTIGSQVVRELGERGLRVRAFVRDRVRAAALFGADVELVRGDFGEPQSIFPALDGVDALFLACANHPRQVEYETSVIDAAGRSGVPRIVKLSAIGAEVGSPLGFWDWQGRIEQHLRAAGLPAVILRPGAYMSALLGAAGTIRHTGSLFVAAGESRTAMVDPRDVAAAAAAVLAEEGHEGRVYVLTGPEALTYHEIARDLSTVMGREVVYVAVSDEEAREGLRRSGTPEWLVENLVTMFALVREGATARTTEDVRRLTGREPRRFAEFARDHASVFGG